jgi:hypothetical protein
MRRISRFVSAVAAVACAIAGLSSAAEQSILGKALTVQDRQAGMDPTKRKVTVSGLEKNSPDTVVGDPTQMGSPGAPSSWWWPTARTSARRASCSPRG